MRSDQPKIKKELRRLKLQVKHLEAICELRGTVINVQHERLIDAAQDLLIAQIEHNRLLENKPALTKRYSIANQLALEINAF